MRIAQIRDMDISNGIGIAASIFFQGCSHHCVGCFNAETWAFDAGKELTKDIEDQFIDICNRPYIKCVSLLGGEPFDQDPVELYNLLSRLKKEVGKPIFVWSGYTFEQLINKDVIKDCFIDGLIDVLIDGKFDLSQRDLTLKLRGSKNQRILNVEETIKQNKIITIQN